MAKKINSHPDEIDLTTFTWVNAGYNAELNKPGCGGCHPGGGGLEFDRNGHRYDLNLIKNPNLTDMYDGDYYKSQWDKSGVIEADCFLCHLPGYNFNERNRQLNQYNFKWAAIAGSGIGQVKGSVKSGKAPIVTYNKRYFNDDGKIVIDISSPPKSDNCNNCHGLADLIKRGFSWRDRKNHDIHSLHGLECTHCHPGNPEHNFAKGNENLSTVRDDLDNTMLKCKGCHYKGVMAAPTPEHKKIKPNHLEKFACEICHIPYVNRAAAKGLDVTTGKVMNYPTPGAGKLGQHLIWKPDFHLDENGKLWPVNQFEANLYTNLDQGIHYPLFAREIGAAYEMIKEDIILKQSFPLIDTEVEIRLMLAALKKSLKNSRRFNSIDPWYHFKGKTFHLDKKGNLKSEINTTWVSKGDAFNISHNVSPTKMALGSNGCDDCHAESGNIFEAWLSESSSTLISSDMVFSLSPKVKNNFWLYLIKKIHRHNCLKPYLIAALILGVYLFLTLIVSRIDRFSSEFGIKKDFFYVTFFLHWFHIILALTFIMLSFSGYIFLFNKIKLLNTFFDSQTAIIRFHWITGITFLTAYCLIFFFRKIKASYCNNLQYLQEKSTSLLNWMIHILSLIMGGSGTALIFRDWLNSDMNYLSAFTHGFFSIVFIGVVIAYFYRKFFWFDDLLFYEKKNHFDEASVQHRLGNIN